MGTNNFHYENADRLYAIEDANEFTLDDVRENFILFDSKKIEKRIFDRDYRDPNENRSYPSAHVGSMFIGDTSFGYPISIRVDIVLRSGYYDHKCFDYNIEYRHDWGMYDNLAYCDRHDIEYHFDLSPKQSERVATAMRRKFEKMEARVLKQMYRFLNENSTQCRKIGSASNGETFYEKTEE